LNLGRQQKLAHIQSPGQLLWAVEFLQCRFRLECLGLAGEGGLSGWTAIAKYEDAGVRAKLKLGRRAAARRDSDDVGEFNEGVLGLLLRPDDRGVAG
jgi:hypothetical protein